MFPWGDVAKSLDYRMCADSQALAPELVGSSLELE